MNREQLIDQAFDQRIREWANDPAMRELAFELLPEHEQQLVLNGQHAERERLLAILRGARRRVQADTIVSRLRAQGWRLLETVGEQAAEAGRWLYDLVRAWEPALRTAHYGTGSTDIELVVEHTDARAPAARELRYRAELVGPAVWQAGGELVLALRVPRSPDDLAGLRGWNEALLLLKLADRRFAYPCWPVLAVQHDEHCELTYEVPFPRGQRGTRGMPVPPAAFTELRLLLPLPF